jgi:hypothetical protein
MASITIDLMGDDDVITVPPEKSKEELAKEEANRQRALEEIFRRAPQPALEIVPVSPPRKPNK